MISIDDLEGEMDIEVKQGPARREGETDEEFLARMAQTNPDTVEEQNDDPGH